MVPAASANPTLETSWLVRVSAARGVDAPQEWPLAFRRPLQAVTTEPGRSAGDPTAAALAVGLDGTVARFSAARGWAPEFLQNGAGQRQTPDLTGVAWPTPGRAHVVGQDGAMWLWRATTGLWEPDPGAPLDFDANLLDIAFDPSNPDRGYAVGRQGVLLRYGKRWTQEALPAEIADKDLLGIAFAGSQAIVAWRAPDGTSSGLLVNSPGQPWRVDAQASELATSTFGSLLAVGGLPDGGAVAAGAGTVIIRDSATAAWRLSDAPLTGLTAVAAAAVRDGSVVRAIVSAWPAPPGGYPANETLTATPPGQSPQLYPSVPAPLRGALLRETAEGWSDQTRRDVEIDLSDTTADPPAQSDQTYGSPWIRPVAAGSSAARSSRPATRPTRSRSVGSGRPRAHRGCPPTPRRPRRSLIAPRCR